MMKKQGPAIVLAIACIVLLFAYANSNKMVNQLREEIAQLQATDAPSMSDQDAERSLAEQTGTVVQIAEIIPDNEGTEENDPRGRLMMENMAKMMENPTMNKVMEASQRGAIGALYTDLIDYLNLDENQEKYFMDLLMYRQMKQVDLAMKMMSGGLTDEEKQSLTDEVAAASDTVKEEMEKFLNNPEDYAEWEFYEKTVGERMMLSQMDQDLAASDAPLSDETYRDLLGMMHDERESFDFTGDLHDQENMDISAERFSDENLQSYANDIQQLNESISRRAETLLTPEQLAAFINALKTTTDMQLAQLEMAKQMFGGGNEGAEGE
jgi:hypothetical protein